MRKKEGTSGNRDKGETLTSGLSRKAAVIGLMAAGAVLLAVGGYQATQQDGGSTIETAEPAATARPEPEQQTARSPTAIVRPEPPREIDVACTNLVPRGARMICYGFEPDWHLSLECSGATTKSDLVTYDAAIGDYSTSRGTARFLSQNPWEFNTSHGVVGSIASTPAACIDDVEPNFDFTLTPQVVPGLWRPQAYVCCRIK